MDNIHKLVDIRISVLITILINSCFYSVTNKCRLEEGEGEERGANWRERWGGGGGGDEREREMETGRGDIERERERERERESVKDREMMIILVVMATNLWAELTNWLRKTNPKMAAATSKTMITIMRAMYWEGGGLVKV